MQTKYVVIDDTGNASYDAKGETPETFATFRAAEKRAKELASTALGETIGIFELVGEASVPLGEVQTARKYPLEHYALTPPVKPKKGKP